MVLSELAATAAKIGIGLISFLCLAATLVVCDLLRKRRIFNFARNFKGYKFYPFIGNAYYTYNQNIFSVVEDAKEAHGLPCNLWNGHDYHYITADAAEIKTVLNHPSSFAKGTLYDNLSIVFGNTLLLAKLEMWKKHRKIFSKSFSQPILNGFVDCFYEKACTLVEVLKKCNERDIYNVFDRLSLDNFCANVMGIDLNIQKDINDTLIERTRRLQTELGGKVFNFYFIPVYLHLIVSKGRSLYRDFLEAKAFIKNAMDTSGITLVFTFTLLGMYPEVQEKVYQEVIQTVGLEGTISYNDLPNLKYTESAIFEAMRLLPVTPILERHAETDIDLGNIQIPARTNVLISVFNLHRSEAYWKDPLEFNPDRFLPEEVAERHPYAFIPFSGGPRNCIGMRYAQMMMKTTVAHVIRNYEFKSKYKSVMEMEFESCVTMKTIHDIDCKFIPRVH